MINKQWSKEKKIKYLNENFHSFSNGKWGRIWVERQDNSVTYGEINMYELGQDLLIAELKDETKLEGLTIKYEHIEYLKNRARF